MKVITDNYNRFPMEVRCIHCNSVIELESIHDVAILEQENDYDLRLRGEWTCPLCGYDNEDVIDD